MFTVAIQMWEEKIKCPICGTANESDAETCKMCKSRLSKKKDGSLKVASPQSKAITFDMIDIDDPITRKKLEDLTLIPGVTRTKAIFLYKSGIHSMEDFLKKAFHGERYSDNFSRTVANKLLMNSLKGKEVEEDLLCPSCEAPNPMNAKKCKVCNFEIEKEMNAIDLNNLSGQLSESVTEMMDDLGEDADFDALPDELKAQFASVLDSDDIDFDMEKPMDLENLGLDLDKIEEVVEEAEVVEENIPEPVEETTPEPEVEEAAPEPEEPQPAEEEPEVEEAAPEPEEAPTEEPVQTSPSQESAAASKEDKVKKVLSGKVDQWRKAGYDIEGLEQYYSDIETFKAKAKEALGKGKIIQKKFEKQMEMWREKGFDVSELEPLLETDLDAFQEKAKEVLKKQTK